MAASAVNYEEFLESKRHGAGDFGIQPDKLSPELFDFQGETVLTPFMGVGSEVFSAVTLAVAC